MPTLNREEADKRGAISEVAESIEQLQEVLDGGSTKLTSSQADRLRSLAENIKHLADVYEEV
jgi:archaellum component FlaC